MESLFLMRPFVLFCFVFVFYVTAWGEFVFMFEREILCCCLRRHGRNPILESRHEMMLKKKSVFDRRGVSVSYIRTPKVFRRIYRRKIVRFGVFFLVFISDICSWLSFVGFLFGALLLTRVGRGLHMNVACFLVAYS